MYEVTEDMPAHAKVVLLEPDEGWSRAHYQQHIAQYTRDRGAAPRTVTLHPETMATLDLQAAPAQENTSERARQPMLISSSTYARDRITLFE
jgi:hypothetical protein